MPAAEIGRNLQNAFAGGGLDPARIVQHEGDTEAIDTPDAVAISSAVAGR